MNSAMKNKPHFISICSQKGGVGKSTFTILLAGMLHYRLGRRVVVADCDYPQWSILEQRRRELEILDRSDYYKLMMIRQYKATGRKIWPVLECRAATALTTVKPSSILLMRSTITFFSISRALLRPRGFYPLLPAWSGFSSR